MQHRLLMPIGWLCRLQRWLAGPDAQFQNGLGISDGRARQHRVNWRNRSARERRIHNRGCVWSKLSERSHEIIPIVGRIVYAASPGIRSAVATRGRESRIRLQRRYV